MSGGYCSPWMKFFLFLSLYFCPHWSKLNRKTFFFLKGHISHLTRRSVYSQHCELQRAHSLRNMPQKKPPTRCQDLVRSWQKKRYRQKYLVERESGFVFIGGDRQWWGYPDEESLSASEVWYVGRESEQNRQWAFCRSLYLSHTHTLAHTMNNEK